jgi:tetratricopeptide (TPR) repeat protein
MCSDLSALRATVLLDALNPKRTDAFFGRAETNLLMKRYEEALSDFNHAIKIDRRDAWLHYGRGITYQTLNQRDTAAADLERAIRLSSRILKKNPQDYVNVCNLALYQLAAGEPGEAEILYQKVLSKEVSAFIQIAIKDLEDFLTVFPDHAEARAMSDLLKNSKRGS